MEIVKAVGLTKYYRHLKAVDGIDLEIHRGECFGLLGPNGAGKTTAMNIICCVMPPSSGSVQVFGMDTTRHASGIKARLGVMPQDNNLDPDLSVTENLVVYARYFDITGRRARDRAAELLHFVDLADKAGVKTTDLSGGMKRRLLLARSLINRPSLLVLDEPTTGLDPHSRHDVWHKLATIKAADTTLLLTTHYMEEARMLCDRVAIMDSGRIVAVDTPSHLMELHGGDLETVYMKLTGRRLRETWQ